MKKMISIVLVLVLLLTLAGCLSGCEREKKPLRILIDAQTVVPESEDHGQLDDYIKNQMQNLLADAKKHGLEDIELEILPAFDNAKRKSMITRLRAEILAGSGPDVFIMKNTSNHDPNVQIQSTPFLEPEKIMDFGLLYPLDEFIESAQFMEWDKLTQSIMAAGWSERYGQVILPISYQLPVTYFRKADVPEVPDPMTFDDMINGDNVLQTAAGAFPYTDDTGDVVIGKLADYRKRQLVFTEEDLSDTMNKLLDFKGTDAVSVPDYMFGPSLCYFFAKRSWQFEGTSAERTYIKNLHRASAELSDHSNYTDEPVTIIPVYNEDGGVTATVDGYAAMSSTTKRPEDAFLILDLLLSSYGQKYYGISGDLIGMGMPVYEYVEEEEGYEVRTDWTLIPENLAEFDRIRDSITQVNFKGTLNYETDLLYQICTQTEESDVDTAIHTSYRRMRQEVSE